MTTHATLTRVEAQRRPSRHRRARNGLRRAKGSGEPDRLRSFVRRWWNTDRYFSVVLTNKGWAVFEVVRPTEPMGHSSRLVAVNRSLSNALVSAERRNREIHLIERLDRPGVRPAGGAGWRNRTTTG